jgi:hypothetical protein
MGLAVGALEGLSVGLFVITWLKVGFLEGLPVGLFVGLIGLAVPPLTGLRVGALDGLAVGISDSVTVAQNGTSHSSHRLLGSVV